MRSQRPLFAANLNKTEASRHLSRELLVRVALGGLRLLGGPVSLTPPARGAGPSKVSRHIIASEACPRDVKYAVALIGSGCNNVPAMSGARS
jgi:hypothetical protein